ncbi:MAG: A/G-specific adenine glycosylase [Caldilineaceae bacterium]
MIADRLLHWHDPDLRALPWRDAPAGKRDPYAVWISEIMAQQTRLETVVNYFTRWMIRFPTVEALAKADLQDVLKAWEGLGYYARARNIHRAAQQIVANFSGNLPDDHNALLSLPGIGAYTAGAILSTAFGQPAAVVDGNVTRVLSRLYDIAQPVDQTDTKRELWRIAQELVEAAPHGQAGAFNEALMELGAHICTPTTPRCLICPLNPDCLALAHGVQHERPVMSPKKKTPHYDVAAGVIWQGEPFASKFLIAQRPVEGMLGGLWEFPGGKLEPTDADLAACLRREIIEELAMEIEVGAQFTVVQHAYTHFRITLHAFHARHLTGEPQAIGCADWRWVEFAELAQFPFPATDQKIIQALQTALL